MTWINIYKFRIMFSYILFLRAIAKLSINISEISGYIAYSLVKKSDTIASNVIKEIDILTGIDK